MNYQELKKLFSDHESSLPKSNLTGYITFSSFGPDETREFPWEGRTYSVSSSNKAFQSKMGGYSIFGSSLDGTDQGVRLDRLMAEEHGGQDGWVVEDCCIVGYMLMEGGDYGIGTPRIFYAIDEAQQEMLSCMARFVNADLASLAKEYKKNNCEADGNCCHAKKFRAYASTIKDSGYWEIKPVYIRSVLDITVGDGRR